jgi:hypothetical protein
MITHRAPDANVHAMPGQVATEMVTVMRKTPEEVFDLVWAFELPYFFPKPRDAVATTPLLLTGGSVSRCCCTGDLVCALDSKNPMLVEVPRQRIVPALVDWKRQN